MPNEATDPRVLNKAAGLLNMFIDKSIEGSRVVITFAHPLPGLIADIVENPNQDSSSVQAHAGGVPKIAEQKDLRAIILSLADTIPSKGSLDHTTAHDVVQVVALIHAAQRAGMD